MFELIAGRFHLLGRTGHDRNVIGAFSVLCILFRIAVTQDRSKHLHGRLAGGNIVQILRIFLLQILHPRRAAGGEHRERTAGRKSGFKLFCFGNRGEVRTESGVVDFIHTHELQGRHQAVQDVVADRQAEGFTDRNTHGRRDLDHGPQLRIVDSAPGFADLVFHGDRADRADRCALTAADAVGLTQHAAEGRSHAHLGAAVHEIDDVHALHFFADTHTVTA